MLVSAAERFDKEIATDIFRWLMLAINDHELHDFLVHHGSGICRWLPEADHKLVTTRLNLLNRDRAVETLSLWNLFLHGKHVSPFAVQVHNLQRLMLEEIFSRWAVTPDNEEAALILEEFSRGVDDLSHLRELRNLVVAVVRESTGDACPKRLLDGFGQLFDPSQGWKDGELRDQVARTLAVGWVRNSGLSELVPTLRAISPLMTDVLGGFPQPTQQADRPDLVGLRVAAENLVRIREACLSLDAAFAVGLSWPADIERVFRVPNIIRLNVSINRSDADGYPDAVLWQELRQIVSAYREKNDIGWLETRLSLLVRETADGQAKLVFTEIFCETSSES
ncbi:MAG: hypothetical protein ABIJ46_00405 [bacterium]